MNAPSNLRREYWQDVASIAREAIETAREYGSELSDVIWESVDGSYWVIYYSRAADVCRFSSNDDAIFDEMGADALSGCASIGEVHTRCAFFALRQDVWDYIDREGLTVEGDEE
jgi:hypothetical protein